MELTMKGNLPYATVAIAYRGAVLDIPDVLIDTGSATTLFAADVVEAIGITPLEQEVLYTIDGVGGDELVFVRKVDYLTIGDCTISNFLIEVGAMDYGFDINGILGMDVFLHSGAAIDFRKLTIDFDPSGARVPEADKTYSFFGMRRKKSDL